MTSFSCVVNNNNILFKYTKNDYLQNTTGVSTCTILPSSQTTIPFATTIHYFTPLSTLLSLISLFPHVILSIFSTAKSLLVTTLSFFFLFLTIIYIQCFNPSEVQKIRSLTFCINYAISKLQQSVHTYSLYCILCHILYCPSRKQSHLL